MPTRKAITETAAAALVLCASQCGGIATGGDSCAPGDQDGVNAGTYVVLVSVSDTGFAVGGVDSGSTERNITVQNLGTVTLTLTNTGTEPHDMTIGCIPTGLPAGCPATSCFPANANIGPLQPGQSMTTTFVTPAVEGAYPFVSDLADDTATSSDGGVTGLVGEFVLM
jgi:hypothetical protein